MTEKDGGAMVIVKVGCSSHGNQDQCLKPNMTLIPSQFRKKFVFRRGFLGFRAGMGLYILIQVEFGCEF